MNRSAPKTAPSLSVVVPVYNEAENVEPLVAELHRVLTSIPGLLEFEIVYVDDGSNDGTSTRLAELRGDFPELRVLRHRTNYGQSAAIRSGIRAARFSTIATLDGDGQNDPGDVPRLLEAYLAGTAELVVGCRRVRRDLWLRRLSSRLANAVRSRLARDNTPDTGCGLKVFGRDAFLALPSFDHMHRFLPSLFMRDGGRVVSIPVNHRPRTRGISKYGVVNRFWVGVVDLLGVLWLQRRSMEPEIILRDKH
jgi:dolichol-phosphate mannosyltransferase